MIKANYIEPKEWNNKLNELNNMNKARYYEVKWLAVSAPRDYETHDEECDLDEYNRHPDTKPIEAYFTVVTKKETGYVDRYGRKKLLSSLYRDENDNYYDGWNCSTRNYIPKDHYVDIYVNTLKVSYTTPAGIPADLDRCYGPCAAIADEIAAPYFDYFNCHNDMRPKFTTLPKNVVDQKLKAVEHKDKYGVIIEIGDWYAYPYGGGGTAARVDIRQAKEFSLSMVDGRRPDRLVVVKSANKNKKLGW